MTNPLKTTMILDKDVRNFDNYQIKRTGGK
jgi:hypothetical protein